jgi:hypothetical protein
MREAVFILLVVMLLAGATAFRYRRQIAAALQIWKMLRSGGASGGTLNAPPAAAALVKCAHCGTLVPQGRAINYGRGIFYCSDNCLKSKTI